MTTSGRILAVDLNGEDGQVCRIPPRTSSIPHSGGPGHCGTDVLIRLGTIACGCRVDVAVRAVVLLCPLKTMRTQDVIDALGWLMISCGRRRLTRGTGTAPTAPTAPASLGWSSVSTSRAWLIVYSCRLSLRRSQYLGAENAARARRRLRAVPSA